MSRIPIAASAEVSTKNIEQQPQANSRQLGGGAGLVLLGRISGRGLAVLNQIFLARLLGPTDFGLYALGWALLEMGSMVLPLGLHQGVVRYGAEYWQKDNRRFRSLLQQSLLLTFLFGGIAALVLFTVSPWLAVVVFKKPALEGVFRGFAVALVMAPVLRVASAATRITLRMTFGVLSEEVVPSLVQLVLMLFLVGILGLRVGGAIVSSIAGFVVAIVLAGIFLGYLFGAEVYRLEPAAFSTRRLLAFSIPASLAGIFVMLVTRTGQFLTGYFMSSSDVGIYQAAWQVAMLFSTILNSFNLVFSPMIARLYQDGEIEQLNMLYKVSTKWGLYISLPLFLVLVIAPRDVMYFMFGEPYMVGVEPMLIMAGAQLFNAATGAVGLLLIMSDHQMHWLSISMASVVINIGLGFLMIPRWGITGAALATTISVVLLYGGGLFYVYRLLGLWPYDWRYRKIWRASIVSLFVLFIGKQMLSRQALLMGIGWLILLATIGIVTFVGVLKWDLDDEDRELWSLVKTVFLHIISRLRRLS